MPILFRPDVKIVLYWLNGNIGKIVGYYFMNFDEFVNLDPNTLTKTSYSKVFSNLLDRTIFKM